jgi:hypothetical protein
VGDWGSGEVGKWGSGEVGKWGSGEKGEANFFGKPYIYIDDWETGVFSAIALI